MIASHDGQFIFIKTRKTASTSTEIVLGSWCGPGDIVTPITAEDELLRRDFGGTAQNFCKNPRMETKYQKAVLAGDLGAIKAAKRRLGDRIQFENHMSAQQVRTMLPELWHSAFTFAVDRHPYEKVVSYAFWEAHQRKITDADRFSALVEETIVTGISNNYPLYSDGGKVIVDRVFRYEDIWRELATLATTLGKSLPDALPRAKSRFRTDRRPAAEILTTAQKRRILQSAAFEFDLLGYDH